MPFSGSLAVQTHFLSEVFEYIEELLNQAKIKNSTSEKT